MKEVSIYTDGACSGNPGAGGYGAILCYRDKSREISAGYRLTTRSTAPFKRTMQSDALERFKIFSRSDQSELARRLEKEKFF